MFNAVIVKEIRDSATGHAYTVGDLVRVLLKAPKGLDRQREYIGIIRDILDGSFLLAGGQENVIKLCDVEKMRLADPGENFYNRFDF